jgi:hypothetical protein
VTTSILGIELPQRIQQLLEQRLQHVDALTKIDHSLAEVTAALGGKTALTKGEPAIPAGRPAVTKSKKHRRKRFAVSATEMVLAFVEEKKNPTTQEIMKHLAAEGRTTGAASNALSVLTHAKKLKRTPLGNGILGSRYSLGW